MKKRNVKRALASVLAALMVVGGTASLQTTIAPSAQAATAASEETALTNNAVLSRDIIYKGDSVNVKCAAAGGKGGYQYAVYYKRSSSTKWYTAQEYSTNKTVSITPTAATSYDITVKVKDAAGKVVKKTLSLNVLPVLENNSSLSGTKVLKGQDLTLKGAATGGSGSYQYAFYYKKVSAKNWTTAQDYSENETVKITPKYAGEYEVSVKVKDSLGRVQKKQLTFEVLSALVNKATLSAKTIFKGESVTATGAASGGAGGYQYAYYYKRDDAKNWSTGAAYGDTLSVTITPKYAGDYDVRIKIKDALGNVAVKDIVLTVLLPFENNSTVSKSTVLKGDSLTLNGAATGGSGGYQYAFYYKKVSAKNWTTAQSYGENNTVTITPKYAGEYEASVKVKDSMGHVQKKQLTFEVLPVLTNKATLSAKTIFKGESITATGAASGGAGGYQYAYYYKRVDAKNWSTGAAYGDTLSVTITPKYAGDYDVRIKIKDALGNVVVKDIVLAVLLPFENNSTVSKSTILKGDSLTLNGAATGGSGGYQYAFHYKKVSAKTWTTAQSYGENDTVNITPKYAGEYEASIKVKDSMGHVQKKQLTFEVLPALENKAALSASTLQKGQPVTVKLAGKGGSGDLVYAVYYRRASSSNWSTAQDYADNTTVEFTPKYAEAYTVRVKVKDSMGHITAKDLQLEVYAALKNTSSVSTDTAHIGEAVVISGAATGGSGEYEYAYFCKYDGDNDWTLMQDYSGDSVFELIPEKADRIQLKVTVRDSLNNSAEKTFTLVVEDDLFNLSSVSADAILKGESVTVTGAASGGSDGYTYAYYYKQVSKDTWTTAKSYSTVTSVEITPRYAADYEIRVDVKDSTGTVAQKFFSLQVNPALTNTSSVNGTSFVTGQNAVITAAGKGGVGELTYAFYYQGSGDNEWTPVQELSSEDTAVLSLTTADTYTIRVVVRDSAGHEAEKLLTITAVNLLENLSSIETARISAGGSITVWGDASGGNGDYQFAFSYKGANDNEWTLVQDFSSENTVSIPLTAAGEYDIRVIVRDTAAQAAELNFMVWAIELPTNTSTVDRTDIVKGQTVTITGSASGGSGGYTFAYAYKQLRSSSWTTIKDFSTDTTASVKLSSAVPYVILVTVRDSLGGESEKILSVNVASVLKNTSTVRAESILMGESVTMTASATGGLGDYTYTYAYKPATVSTWTVLDEASSTAVFTPPAAGTYDLQITVTDSSGTEKSKSFTLEVNRAFVNNSTVSTTETTVGGRAVLTAIADGQSTAYTHAFRYRTPASAAWITLQDYSTDSSYTMNFTSAGSYELCVSIRDNLGNVEDKTFTVTVLENVTNLSTVDKTQCFLTESVTLSAAAAGGTGTYTYSYFYKENSDNYWTMLQNDSADTTVSFTPTAAGDYDLRVVATDSSGNTDYKDFVVTVLVGFENTSSVDQEYVLAGGVLTLTASATGGTTPYTYAYYYSWDDGQTWNTAYDFSDVTVLRMTLSSAADYLFRIDVKGADGEIASKYFNVIVRDEVITNASYLESAEVKLGTNVVVHNAFEGGVGTVTYSTYYRLLGNTSWKTVSTNSSSAATTFKPNAVGTYEVRSVVKDVQGNTAESIFTLEIVDEYFDVKLDNILSEILNPNMDELRKLKAIHDWMINYADYDSEGYASGNIDNSSHTAKGFIENKKAVCDGYAETFLLLTQKAGFECIMVTGVSNNGSGNESHAWNQVKMNGSWYNVDVTWDDPVISGTSDADNLTYQYFLIPDSVINTNHYAQSTTKSCTTAQPTDRLISMVLSDELQSHSDYAYCTSDAELKSAMQSFYDDGVMTFTLIYRTTETKKQNILSAVAAQRPAYTGMSGSVIEWKFSGYYRVTITLS